MGGGGGGGGGEVGDVMNGILQIFKLVFHIGNVQVCFPPPPPPPKKKRGGGMVVE